MISSTSPLNLSQYKRWTGCGELQENYNEVTAPVTVAVPDLVFWLKHISKHPGTWHASNGLEMQFS